MACSEAPQNAQKGAPKTNAQPVEKNVRKTAEFRPAQKGSHNVRHRDHTQTHMNLKRRKAQKTQEEVSNGVHHKVSGTISGICPGTIHIEIMDVPPPSSSPRKPSGSAPTPMVKITQKGSGPFSILSPKLKDTSLVAMCDADNDMEIRIGSDKASLPMPLNPKSVEEPLTLKLEDVMAAISRDKNNVEEAGPSSPPPLGDEAKGKRYDLNRMKPTLSQSELEGQVQIMGHIKGRCDGEIRIDILEKSFPQNMEIKEMLPRPLTSIKLEGVSDFSMMAPKDKNLNIIAICDVKKDGLVEDGVDQMSLPVSLDAPEPAPTIHTINLELSQRIETNSLQQQNPLEGTP